MKETGPEKRDPPRSSSAMSKHYRRTGQSLYDCIRVWSSTIVIFKEDSDGEGADLVLGTDGEGRVDGADDAQSLHDEGEHLRAELRRQLDQALEDAGEEGLEDVGALRQLQLITVPGERREWFICKTESGVTNRTRSVFGWRPR